MARTEVDAVSFGVTFLGVKDIYSADNSSPQTTEINAKRRVATLMKWVNIAAVESFALILLMTSAAPKGHKRWPLMGGLTSLIITYGQYLYAKSCGMKSMDQEGTEDYGPAKSVARRRSPSSPHPGKVV